VPPRDARARPLSGAPNERRPSVRCFFLFLLFAHHCLFYFWRGILHKSPNPPKKAKSKKQKGAPPKKNAASIVAAYRDPGGPREPIARPGRERPAASAECEANAPTGPGPVDPRRARPRSRQSAGGVLRPEACRSVATRACAAAVRGLAQGAVKKNGILPKTTNLRGSPPSPSRAPVPKKASARARGGDALCSPKRPP
jgi:hypothetical protein